MELQIPAELTLRCMAAGRGWVQEGITTIIRDLGYNPSNSGNFLKREMSQVHAIDTKLKE